VSVASASIRLDMAVSGVRSSWDTVARKSFLSVSTSEHLRLIFERAGYIFISCPEGRSGLRTVHEERPDLVLLDVGLPGMDGWTVLERIRDLADLPVLMLSAHGDETDKVRGLRAGADDYVTKPFTNNELLARAEALLRRAGGKDDRAAVHDDGLVRIDRRARCVHVTTPCGTREVRLTRMEFRLLNVLVTPPARCCRPNNCSARSGTTRAASGPSA